MRQVIADASGNGKIVIFNNDVDASYGIAGGSCIGSDKTPFAQKTLFAQKTMRHPSSRGRAAPLRITAALLAAAWAETQGFPEARPALADALVSAQHVTAARNVDFGGTAGDGAFQTVQAGRGGDKPVQLAQTTTSETEELQQTLEHEHHRVEMLSRELAVARHDVELLLTLLNKSRDESARVKQVAESETAELRKSLQQERDRVGRLEQDLTAARRGVETQRKAGDEAGQPNQAADGGAAELRRSMQRDRSQRLERELATVPRDVEPQTALAGKASAEATRLKQAAESGTAELQKSLQQERERAERLEQNLAKARRDVETQTALAAKASGESTRLKQAAESGTAELQKSLQQERERAERLEQDLATARRDVETQTALAAKANGESTQLKQAAESGTTELRKSLQQEHERAEGLEQGLSIARTRIYAYEAQASKASEEQAQLRRAAEGGAPALRKSAQEQHDRADRLERDLASARRDVETQTTLAAKAGEEATRLKQLAEQDSAELRRSLQQERDRAEGLERDLQFARHMKDAPVAPGVVTVGETAPDKRFEAQAKPTADQVTVADALGEPQPNPEDAAEVARLVALASVLLGRGDIGAARIVLERAAETGSAQASFTLAETYDPLILPKWGTYGTRGDATKARALYAKAEAGGIKQAKQRFDALRR